MRLCFGTFAALFKLCAGRNLSNGALCTALLSWFMDENEITYRNLSTPSRWVNCIQGFKHDDVEHAMSIDIDTTVNHFYTQIEKTIQPFQKPIFILALRDIILSDEKIPDDTVVDSVSNLRKGDLTTTSVYDLVHFITGTFRYALTVDNRIGKEYVKKINRDFLDSFEIRRDEITVIPHPRGIPQQPAPRYPIEVSTNEYELLDEVDQRCPIPGCNLKLRPVRNGSARNHYEFLQLRPKTNVSYSTPTDKVLINYLAMCKEHYEQYNVEFASETEWSGLREIKDHLYKRREAKNRLYDIDLHMEIKSLLERFDLKQRTGNEPDKNWSIHDLPDKFDDTESFLYKDVKDNVVLYFPMLNNVIMDYERENDSFSSTTLRAQVNLAYCHLRGGGFTQDEIFSKLTEWLREKTESKDDTVCRIVIAYYIRLCAVFEVKKKNGEANESAE